MSLICTTNSRHVRLLSSIRDNICCYAKFTVFIRKYSNICLIRYLHVVELRNRPLHAGFRAEGLLRWSRDQLGQKPEKILPQPIHV